MIGRNRKKVVTTLLLVCIAVMTGCESLEECNAERDALYAQNTELQDELDQTRTALSAAESDRVALQDEVNRLNNQLANANSQPAIGANTGFDNISGVEIIPGRGTVTVRVPGDVLFDSGKATVRDSAKKTLSKIADVIKRDYSGNTIRVEGYTDTDKIQKSSWKDNLDLSLNRAAAVHRFLASKGVNENNMYAAGFGATKPKGTKAASRRVEVVVVLDQ